MVKEQKRLIIGWKDIAAHLSCSVMTAHRRAKEGLPIFRVGGSVRAYADDLDAWVESSPLRPPSPVLPETPGLIVDSANLPANLLSMAGGTGGARSDRFAIIPLGQDNTIFRAEETRRRRAEEKFEWLFERVPVWIWELSEEGTYANSNMAVNEILGYDAEALQGFTPTDFLVHADDVPLFRNQMAALRNEGRIIRGMRLRFSARDGSLRWLETDCERYFDERGRFAGVRGVSRDISYRVLLEKEALEARRYFESVILGSGEAVITVDAEGRIKIWNDGAYDLFGYVGDDVRGQPFSSVTGLIPPGVTFRAFLKNVKRRKGRTLREEVPAFRKDGTQIRVAATFSVVSGADDDVSGLAIIARDVTEREKYEAALKGAADEWQNTFNAVADAILVVDERYLVAVQA